jgi:hypothetical protein
MMSCSFEGQFQIEEKSLNETMILIITRWASKKKKKIKACLWKKVIYKIWWGHIPSCLSVKTNIVISTFFAMIVIWNSSCIEASVPSTTMILVKENQRNSRSYFIFWTTLSKMILLVFPLSISYKHSFFIVYYFLCN